MASNNNPTMSTLNFVMAIPGQQPFAPTTFNNNTNNNNNNNANSNEPSLEALESELFPSFEVLFRALNAAARRLGFYASIRRSSNKGADGVFRRYDLECSEGRSLGTSASGKRHSGSLRKNCGWRAKAVFYYRVNAWQLILIEKEHTHPLDPEQAWYLAGHRRLDRSEDVIARITHYAKQRQMTASDILSHIRAEFPNIAITLSDIKNLTRTIKKDDDVAEPLSPMQAFLNRVKSSPGVIHRIYQQENQDDGNFERLFWTYPYCLDEWRLSPEIWFVDYKYKTSDFDMPLLQIWGTTSMHTTFPIAYFLLRGDKEACFSWAFEVIESVRIEYGIPRPKVIITDYDKPLKRACTRVFDDVQQQICLWHVMKNVAFQTKRRWAGSLDGTSLGKQGGDTSYLRDEDPEYENRKFDVNAANHDRHACSAAPRLLQADDQSQRLISSRNVKPSLPGQAPPGFGRKWLDNADGFLCAWSAVVYADTEHSFWEEWNTLMREFPGQASLINYVREVYLPFRYEFAHFALKTYPNFGIRVTSHAEGEYNLMRRLLKHRSIDPNGLPETLEELLDRLRHSTDQKRADQRMRTLSIYIPIRIMSPLRSYVSYPALDLIAKEIEAAEGSIRNNEELPTCTGLHRKRYGLPCRHEIVNVIRSDGQLSVNDIDKHWWLRREESSSTSSARIPRPAGPTGPAVAGSRPPPITRNGTQALPPSVHARGVGPSQTSVRPDSSPLRSRKRPRSDTTSTPAVTQAQSQSQTQSQSDDERDARIQRLEEQLERVTGLLTTMSQALSAMATMRQTQQQMPQAPAAAPAAAPTQQQQQQLTSAAAAVRGSMPAQLPAAQALQFGMMPVQGGQTSLSDGTSWFGQQGQVQGDSTQNIWQSGQGTGGDGQ